MESPAKQKISMSGGNFAVGMDLPRSPTPVGDLNFLGNMPGAPTNSKRTIGVDPVLEQKLVANFSKILATNQGVLFENELVQVSLRGMSPSILSSNN